MCKLKEIVQYFPCGKYYHLSLVKLPKILKPRIPDNFLVQHGFEDNTSKRVSTCTSIDNCLRAMSMDLKGKTLNVYELKTDAKIKTPTLKEVPDSGLTGEIWLLGNCETFLLGAIKVIKAKPYPLTYSYGKNYKSELYDWVWKEVII